MHGLASEIERPRVLYRMLEMPTLIHRNQAANRAKKGGTKHPLNQAKIATPKTTLWAIRTIDSVDTAEPLLVYPRAIALSNIWDRGSW
jgi:hypothetical protein